MADRTTISIGELKQRVTLQYRTRVQDSSGSWTDTWTDWKTNVPARIRPISGREYYVSSKPQSTVSHEIAIRYLAGVKPAYRISWGSRTFDIDAVINIGEENRFLILNCEETVGETA